MSLNAGAVTGSISLDTAPLAASVGRARGMMAGLRDSTHSMFANLGGTATRIGGLLTAALGGIGVGAALKLSADFEQAQVSFEVLLGSATKATQVLGELNRFAARTPFQLTGLTQATKTLLNFGLSADSVMPTIDMLSNVAAGNEDKLRSLALVYGQVSSAGRLMGQDLLQFINTGFNPLQQISKRTGESMAQLKKRMEAGGIGIDEVRQAFVSATSKGGRFYGMNEKQSKTLAGVWSTLRDSVNVTLQQVGDALVANLDIKGLIKRSTASLQAAIPKIVGVATALTSAAASAGRWIAQNRQLLTSIGVVTGGIAGITIAVIGLTTAVAVLTSPVALVVAGIATVGTAIALSIGEGVTTTDRLKDGFLKMATSVVTAGVGAFTAVEVAITNWRDTFTLVQASAELSIRGIVGGFVHGLTVNIPEALGWLSRNWRDLFAGILQFTTGVLENLSQNIRAAFTAIWEFIKSGGTSGFQVDWTPLTEGIHVAFREELKLTSRELSDREKELTVQIGDTGGRLGAAFGEKMQSRVDATLKALGLKDSGLAGGAGDQPAPPGVIKRTASEVSQTPAQVLDVQKLAGLNFVGSSQELQLRAKQRLAASGATGGTDAKGVPKKQLDEQKVTNKKLDAVASLLRQMVGEDQTVSIPVV